jgi:hypothetical protein
MPQNPSPEAHLRNLEKIAEAQKQVISALRALCIAFREAENMPEAAESTWEKMQNYSCMLDTTKDCIDTLKDTQDKQS